MIEITWGEIAGLLMIFIPFVILILPQLIKKRKQRPE